MVFTKKYVKSTFILFYYKTYFDFFVSQKSHFSKIKIFFFLQKGIPLILILPAITLIFYQFFWCTHISMTITKILIRGTVGHNCWQCHNVLFKGGWKLLKLMQYEVRRVMSSSQRWAFSSWCYPSLFGETPPLGKINPFGFDPFTLP